MLGTKMEATGKVEYLTPKFIIDALGPFDLDPCAPIIRPWDTAKEHFTGEHTGGLCGLKMPWHGFVWCNPPYGKRNGENAFIEKMAVHDNGFALIMPKIDTILWRDIVWPNYSAMLFFYGRVKFLHKKYETIGYHNYGTVGGSALVAFGKEAVKRIGKLREYGHIIYNAERTNKHD